MYLWQQETQPPIGGFLMEKLDTKNENDTWKFKIFAKQNSTIFHFKF